MEPENNRFLGWGDNIWVYKTSGHRHLQDKATIIMPNLKGKDMPHTDVTHHLLVPSVSRKRVTRWL